MRSHSPLLVGSLLAVALAGCTINEPHGHPPVEREPHPDAVSPPPLVDAGVALDAGRPPAPVTSIVAPDRRAGEGCVEDADCAAAHHCLLSRCTLGCQLHDDCLPGRCGPHGVCTAAPDGVARPPSPAPHGRLTVSPSAVTLGDGAATALTIATSSAATVLVDLEISGWPELWFIGPGGSVDRRRTRRVEISDRLAARVEVASARTSVVGDQAEQASGGRRRVEGAVHVVSALGAVDIPVVRQATNDAAYVGALTLDAPVDGGFLPLSLWFVDPLGTGKPVGELSAVGTPWLSADRRLTAVAPVDPSPWLHRFLVRDSFDSALMAQPLTWWLLLELSPADAPGHLWGRFRLGFDGLPQTVGWAGDVELVAVGPPPRTASAAASEVPRPATLSPQPLAALCPAEMVAPGAETYRDPWLDGVGAALCLMGQPCPLPAPWVDGGPEVQDEIWARLRQQYDAGPDTLAARCCEAVAPSEPGDPGLRCARICTLPPPLALDEGFDPVAGAAACTDELTAEPEPPTPGPRARPRGCIDRARTRCAARLSLAAARRQVDGPPDALPPGRSVDALLDATWMMWTDELDATRLAASALADRAVHDAPAVEKARALLDKAWRTMVAEGLIGLPLPGTIGSADSAAISTALSAAASGRLRAELDAMELERGVRPGQPAASLADLLLSGALTARFVTDHCRLAPGDARCRAARDEFRARSRAQLEVARQRLVEQADLSPWWCSEEVITSAADWQTGTEGAFRARLRDNEHALCRPVIPSSEGERDEWRAALHRALGDVLDGRCGSDGSPCGERSAVGELAARVGALLREQRRLGERVRDAALAAEVAEARFAATARAQLDALRDAHRWLSSSAAADVLADVRAAAGAVDDPLDLDLTAPTEVGGVQTVAQRADELRRDLARRIELRAPPGREPGQISLPSVEDEPSSSGTMLPPPGAPSAERVIALGHALAMLRRARASSAVDELERVYSPSPTWSTFMQTVIALRATAPAVADLLVPVEVIEQSLDDLRRRIEILERLDAAHREATVQARAVEAQVISALVELDLTYAARSVLALPDPAIDRFAYPLRDADRLSAEVGFWATRAAVCRAIRGLEFEAATAPTLTRLAAEADTPEAADALVEHCGAMLASALDARSIIPARRPLAISMPCDVLGRCTPLEDHARRERWTRDERVDAAMVRRLATRADGTAAVVFEWSLDALPMPSVACGARLHDVWVELDVDDASAFGVTAALLTDGLVSGCHDERREAISTPPVTTHIPVVARGEAREVMGDVAVAVPVDATTWRLELTIDDDDPAARLAEVSDIVLRAQISEPGEALPPLPLDACSAEGELRCE